MVIGSYASGAVFVKGNQRLLQNANYLQCETFASGSDLTELGCVMMAEVGVLGYILLDIDTTGVRRCQRCGPGVIGTPVPANVETMWMTEEQGE